MSAKITCKLTPESIERVNRLGEEIEQGMRGIVRDVICMSAKSDSLQPSLTTHDGTPIDATNAKITPSPKAILRVELSDIVEVHWPNDNGVELVQVLLVDTDRVLVERIDYFKHEDAKTYVRKQWLRPFTQ